MNSNQEKNNFQIKENTHLTDIHEIVDISGVLNTTKNKVESTIYTANDDKYNENKEKSELGNEINLTIQELIKQY